MTNAKRQSVGEGLLKAVLEADVAPRTVALENW